MAISVHLSNHDNASASVTYSNLSDLGGQLGNLEAARSNADLAVSYADRSNRLETKILSRATRARYLCLSGRVEQAQRQFAEAEALAGGVSLTGPQGAFYCELLLSGPTRMAWSNLLFTGSGSASPDLAGLLDEVDRRVNNSSLDRVVQNDLLSQALDELTLGHVELLRSVLGLGIARHASPRIVNAVDMLRRSGYQDELAKGLLLAAWSHFLDGNLTDAARDLDKAYDMADRNAMRTMLADVHLQKARLFRDGDSLVKARVLIEECQYGFRIGELEDAERAAKVWAR
jgi:tetratricopeptide (TPR) repeat protein